MNKTLVVISAIVVGIALFAGGAFFAQVNAQEGQPGEPAGNGAGEYGPGMMDNWDGQVGADMMNSGTMNGSMMGNYGDLADVDLLSIEDAETAVTTYLATLDNTNLAVGEIMIFANHAYAQILDTETGVGALEVLVDPVTQNVYPEPGPNMMWNTEFGMMSGSFDMMDSMMNGGMMGGSMMDGSMMGNWDGENSYGPMDGSMMDNWDEEKGYGPMDGSMMDNWDGSTSGYGMMGGGLMGGMMSGGLMGGFAIAPGVEISVTADQALQIAQQYLDGYLPDTTVDQADTFPGYYTLHVEQDGEIIGMLSVNAYTGQVFLHHWHGDFIEMSGEDHS
ncbi:MAG: hypothetical protein ACE5EY_03950 [Anaerolineae bacterium]